jgi:hypothetical protein
MSTSHDRKVDAYLKPTNHKLVSNYVQNNNVSKSKAINELLEKIPEQVKKDILKGKSR